MQIKDKRPGSFRVALAGSEGRAIMARVEAARAAARKSNPDDTIEDASAEEVRAYLEERAKGTDAISAEAREFLQTLGR